MTFDEMERLVRLLNQESLRGHEYMIGKAKVLLEDPGRDDIRIESGEFVVLRRQYRIRQGINRSSPTSFFEVLYPHVRPDDDERVLDRIRDAYLLVQEDLVEFVKYVF
jgi:hypothetical protein